MRQADVAEVEAVLEQETREGRPKLQLRAEWEQNEELIVFFFESVYTKKHRHLYVFFLIYMYIYIIDICCFLGSIFEDFPCKLCMKFGLGHTS